MSDNPGPADAGCFDVAIVGAGPAGMSCALWLSNYGLRHVLVDAQARAGGLQARNYHPNTWVLGIEGLNGIELARRFETHLRKDGASTQWRLSTHVVGMDAAREGFELQLADGPASAASHEQRAAHADGRSAVPAGAGGKVLNARAVLLALGSVPRSTAVIDAVRRANDHVIVGPDSLRIRDEITAGHRVLVLGGGDNAFEHAVILGERGCEVVLACARRPRARPDFSARAQALPRVSLRIGGGEPAVESQADGSLRAHFGKGEQERFDYVLVMYGYAAPTELLASLGPKVRPALDAQGFVVVDASMRTSIPGIYAAGDINNHMHPCVATAMGHGATAAYAIEQWLSGAQA